MAEQMPSLTLASTYSWQVGARTASVALAATAAEGASSPLELVVTWAPDEPQCLTDGEWRQHREGRAKAISAIADTLHINLVLLELGQPADGVPGIPLGELQRWVREHHWEPGQQSVAGAAFTDDALPSPLLWLIRAITTPTETV